jgi:hypothetical protein
VRFIWAVLLLVTTSGCVVQQIKTGDDVVWPSASAVPCDPETIRMAHRVIDATPEWVTVARRVVVADGRVRSETVPWNQPIEPELTWKSEKRAADADVLRKLPDDLKTSVATKPSPGLDQVVAIMSGRRSANGTHVGFAAVKRVILGFVIDCPDGPNPPLLDPVFTSWADSEIGVVDCRREPADGVPRASGFVKARFC